MLKAFHDHMHPERTLVIDMGRLGRGFPQHFDRYPGAAVVPWTDGHLEEGPVREWLRGLDVVYAAETLYDARIASWAAEEGVAVVCHAMAEFMGREGNPAPVSWWAPTGWRMDTLPAGTRLVPVPVDRAVEPRPAGDRLRVVHVAGHRAALDRNGTNQVLASLRYLRAPVDVTVFTQDRRLPTARAAHRNVRYQPRLGGVEDRWAMYDADVMVMPRRYGGLSLPVQEALSCGLAVVMPDVAPNQEWPVILTACRPGGTLTTAAGDIGLVTADPLALAGIIDQLAEDRTWLTQARSGAHAWAEANTWEALRPLYEAELARACQQ